MNARHQQRVAVGGRIHDYLSRKITAGAGSVLHDEGLAEMIRQPLPDQPCINFEVAAAGKARR